MAIADRQTRLDGIAFAGAAAVEGELAGQSSRRQPRPAHAEDDDGPDAAEQDEALRVEEEAAEQRGESGEEKDAERVVEQSADVGAEVGEDVVGHQAVEKGAYVARTNPGMHRSGVGGVGHDRIPRRQYNLV